MAQTIQVPKLSCVRTIVFLLTVYGAILPSSSASESEDIQIEMIPSDVGIIQIQRLSNSGTMLGTREMQRQGVLMMSPFVVQNGKSKKPPVLSGFTAADFYNVSETGVVVGTAGRAPNPEHSNFKGYLWSIQHAETIPLPLPDSFTASRAIDISASGKSVSGFVVGSKPPRIVPCVWRENESRWQCDLLSVSDVYNPFLTSSKVVISDDGQFVAACISDTRSDKSVIARNRLHLWTREGDQWTRKKVSERGFGLAEVNNQGQVVGYLVERGFRYPVLIDPTKGMSKIDLLPGDVRGQAMDINNQGTVVGFSDDPGGPTGGPQAIVCEKGKTRPLELPSGTIYSSALTINDKGEIGGYLIGSKSAEDKTEIYSAFVVRPRLAKD